MTRSSIAFALAALVAFVAPGHGCDRIAPGFVLLRHIDPTIQQDIRYAGRDNFTGDPLPGYRAAECILRRPAALALKRVQDDLAKADLSLKVYDCYRPVRAVTAMARWTRDAQAGADTHRFYPHIDKSRLFALGYISPESAHSRGVAVDLTLVPRNSAVPAFDPGARYGSCAGPVAARGPDNSLDMGTGFDCFDVRSATANRAITAAQRANRKLLRDAMARHGFVNYRREWWHYSFPAADPKTAFDFPVMRE